MCVSKPTYKFGILGVGVLEGIGVEDIEGSIAVIGSSVVDCAIRKESI